MSRQLDFIDKRILDELQGNGRIPIVELANRVNLTKTPCSERVRRMEKSGIIKNYSAMVDPKKVGLNHLTVVHLTLDRNQAESFSNFHTAVKKVPEIHLCLMIAGHFDYVLHVRTRDISHYRQLLGDTISKLPSVQQSHSFAVMESIKNDHSIKISDQ